MKEQMEMYDVVEYELTDSGVMDIDMLTYHHEENKNACKEPSIMDTEYSFPEALAKCKPPVFKKQPNGKYHVVWYEIARYYSLYNDESPCGDTDIDKEWFVNDKLEPEEL